MGMLQETSAKDESRASSNCAAACRFSGSLSPPFSSAQDRQRDSKLSKDTAESAAVGKHLS
eukprot:7366428-Alexandrium_andersonii.AAC.1